MAAAIDPGASANRHDIAPGRDAGRYRAANPITLLTVTCLLAVTGLTACLIPARRATQVDPLVPFPLDDHPEPD